MSYGAGSPCSNRAMFKLAHRAGLIYLDAAPVQGPDQAWEVIMGQLGEMRSAANNLWRRSDFAAAD